MASSPPRGGSGWIAKRFGSGETGPGGRVRWVSCLDTRSGGRAEFAVPLHALLTIDLPTYEAGVCPLCAKGLPVVKPGSRPVVA